MKNNSDKRLAKAKQLSDAAGEREQRELQRLKKRLQSIPLGQCVAIWKPEADVLLRALQINRKRGKPARLAEHHRLIAVHYWWLRERGISPDKALETVPVCWNISEEAVKKFAQKYKKAAWPTVCAFLADSSNVVLPPEKDSPPRTVSTVQYNIDLWAEAFRNLSR